MATGVKIREVTKLPEPSGLGKWLADKLKKIVETMDPVNRRDSNGATPLHVVIVDNDTEGARELVGRGAIVNATDAIGDTPLHVAARLGNVGVLRMLVETGRAEVNARGDRGWTPLIGAVHRGQAEAVNFLLRHGADCRLADDDGKTAADHASAALSGDGSESRRTGSCMKTIAGMLDEAAMRPVAEDQTQVSDGIRMI